MANRMGVVGRCGKQKAHFVALMGRVKVTVHSLILHHARTFISIQNIGP